MRSFVPTALLLVAISFAHRPARATDCGNVTAQGLCQDAKTLVFCEDGELETIRCQLGELCSFDERFNGAAGCIATRYAGCGSVPEQGECAGSTLLYCANGSVAELDCPAGTACQSVAVDGEVHYDCVAQSSAAAGNSDDDNSDVPVEPGQDSDGIDNPTPVSPTDRAPLPVVQKGGAGAASDYDAGGGGCDGGAVSASALVGIAALALRRRSRSR